jgi:outer membrane receptor for ferrienterochelin and colicin
LHQSPYVQDEWRILPQVTINYGLRLDYVDQYTSEGQASPRINAVWKPTATTTITAGYSRYFVPPPFELVSPSSIALSANTTAAPAVTQDSTVKAERSNYFDVGISQVTVSSPA